MMGEGDITKYVGNVLAVVAAENPDALDEIASLVEVDYTPLTPVTTPEDALKFDAPLIHPDGNVMSRSALRRGDADAAIRASRYVVTRKYRTGWQEHGFLEPECAVALPEGEDGILVYTSSQSVYDVQRECARAGVCRGPSRGGRRDSGLYLQPVCLRCAARVRQNAEPARRKGARAGCAGGRRLRRQGGHDRSALCGADGLADKTPGEAEVFPSGVFGLSRQAPSHDHGVYHGL